MYWIGTWLLQLQAAAARERGAGVASAVNRSRLHTCASVVVSVLFRRRHSYAFIMFQQSGKNL